MGYPERMYLNESLDGIEPMEYIRGDIVECIREQHRAAKAIVDQLPKCWGLRDGVLVQDVAVVPGMEVWLWCREGLNGPHRVTEPWKITAVYRTMIRVKKSEMNVRVVIGWVYNSREAAEAAGGA